VSIEIGIKVSDRNLNADASVAHSRDQFTFHLDASLNFDIDDLLIALYRRAGLVVGSLHQEAQP